jgi:hypothetical protein
MALVRGVLFPKADAFWFPRLTKEGATSKPFSKAEGSMVDLRETTTGEEVDS